MKLVCICNTRKCVIKKLSVKPFYTLNYPQIQITLLIFQNSIYMSALNKCTSSRHTNASEAICRGAKKVRLIGVRDHVHASHLESNINIPCPLRCLAMRDDWCISLVVDGNRARGDVGAAVSEHACLKNTAPFMRKNINSRQIDQLFTVLTTMHVYMYVCH